MQHHLNEEQLAIIVRNSLYFDDIEPALPESLQARLHALQQRAGNAYAGYVPTAEEAEFHGIDVHPPMVAEAQAILGQTYLALQDEGDKAKLKSVMEELGLNPSITPYGQGRQKGRE